MKRKLPNKLHLPRPSYPLGKELLVEVVQLVASSPAQNLSDATPERMALDGLSKALIVIANQSWRMTTAIHDPDSKEPKSELSPQDIKKISNSLDAMRETIETLGIKVYDRLNEPFNPGLPDHVVTEEPREGISQELISRTIRPTIMWNQTMVQRGEIDIAVPQVKKCN